MRWVMILCVVLGLAVCLAAATLFQGDFGLWKAAPLSEYHQESMEINRRHALDLEDLVKRKDRGDITETERLSQSARLQETVNAEQDALKRKWGR